MKIQTYEIDELANLVPIANPSEFNALKEDIKLNGQRDPILLWHGKVVDGRNRQEACKQLGVDVKVSKLDDTLSRNEVTAIVKSANTRRNLTETQKVMSAVKYQKQYGGTNNNISTAWGISERTFKNGKYIAENRPEFIDPLYQGKSVKIMDVVKEIEVTTNKINGIARLVKAELEHGNIIIDESEIVDFTFSVDGLLKTENAKQWFYQKKDDLGFKSPQIIADYIELANLKFKLQK